MSFSFFFFHILFYCVVLFLIFLKISFAISLILILLSILWRHFPAKKKVKIEKNDLEYKV